MLIFLLAGVVHYAIFTSLTIGLILVSLGFVYSLYFIFMLSLSMELIPAGKTGLFDVLVGLGAGFGSFIGPYLVDTKMFIPTFLVAALLFFIAFLVLKIF